MELGFYVGHFSDDSYGIVNLNYISQIDDVQHDFARPFRYLFGIEKSGTKDDALEPADRLRKVFEDFDVTRDLFYELIYFLKYKDHSPFHNSLKDVYLLGIRLGIGHMADLCYNALTTFRVPHVMDSCSTASLESLEHSLEI